MRAGSFRKCAIARSRPWLVALALLASSGGGGAQAQLPVPQLTTIFPAGAQAGTSLEVTVSGTNLDELSQLVFGHPGFTATAKVNPPGEFDRGPQPQNGVFRVQVDSQVPPGFYEVWAVGRFGVTNPRVFAVGHQPELLDDGKNREPSAARPLPIPAVVQGVIDANSADYFQFELQQGQRLIVGCQARALDSRLEPVLVLTGPDGRELRRTGRSATAAPCLDFMAPRAATYRLALFDAVYAGGPTHIYRLVASSGPSVDFVFPAAAQAGGVSRITVYGRGLPQSQPSDVVVGGVPLESVTLDITAPVQVGTTDAARWGLGPRESVIDTFTYPFAGQALRLGIARDPIVREVEPNATGAVATAVSPPCEIAGQFFPNGDLDTFQFAGKKGDIWRIEVQAHRLGYLCDPSLLVQRVVQAEDGSEQLTAVTQVDDPADRNQRIAREFDVSSDDPALRFVVPDDGVYRLLIRDQFNTGRADPRRVYRLLIRREAPDFRLLALPRQIKVNNENEVATHSLSLRRGGGIPLEVLIDRQDDFPGDIELRAVDLPAGVTCRPVTVGPAVETAWLVLESADDAPASVGPIRVIGVASVGDRYWERTAQVGSIAWGTANRTTQPAVARMTGHLVLAVVDKQPEPARLRTLVTGILETSLGGMLEIPVEVRRQEGFKEPVPLVAVGLPANLKPNDLTVPPDQSTATLVLPVQNAQLKPGTYSFMLRSDTKVNLSPNPDAVASAEADQQHAEGLLKQRTEAQTAANTAKDEAIKITQQAEATQTEARTRAEQLANAEREAAAAATEMAQRLAAVQEAAQKDPQNETLTANLAAAKQAAEESRLRAEAAKQSADTARQQLVDSETRLQAAKDSQVEAEGRLTAAMETTARITAHKQAIDKRLDEIKKAQAPRDINIALVATPVTVRIVASPLKLVPAATEAAVKPGEKYELGVAVDRLYGFAEAVELVAEAPKGVNGITVTKADLAKEAGNAKLEISVDAKTPPGRHLLTLRARAKFNNVNVETTEAFTLEVPAPAPAAQ